MRARYISGMLFSSFRRARSSKPILHASSTRYLSSSILKKVPVTQRMQFARRYANEKDLICPIKYFREEFSFLNSLDGNELLALFGKKGESEVSRKVAKAVRSLLGIILGNHAVGIACGDSLRLSNLRISRSLGEFALLDPPKKNSKDTLLGDFGRVADVLDEIAKLVLGPGVVMPRVWDDFIMKLREEFPRVELIVYHSLFLPVSLRYWLLVTVDQRFRKDFDSLKQEQKDAIRVFFKELGKLRKEDLASLASSNEFIKFISLKSRRGSKARKKGKSNSDLSSLDAIFSDKARDIIACARDSCAHGCKSKKELQQPEKDAMPSIKHHWRTREKIIQLLAVLFELLEQTYIDLCYNDKALWSLLGLAEVFGETEETWKAALDAIEKEIDGMKAAERVKEKALAVEVEEEEEEEEEEDEDEEEEEDE